MSTDINRTELATVAAAMAGPGATDKQIVDCFARASLMLMAADDWIADQVRRNDDVSAYVMAVAENADTSDWCDWSDERLHRISAYDRNHPNKSPVERGKLLFDAVDKQVKRHFSEQLPAFREKYRKGIPESLFRQLWPALSKWRRDN